MRKNVQALIIIIVLVTISIVLTATTLAALSINRTLSTSGAITVAANLGVYSDSACTTSISTINWGSLSPGGTAAQTVYVKNTGTGTSLTLSMSTSNWSPTGADQSITVTWNKANTRLAPGQSTPAILTLAVSQNIVDVNNFSVQISIAGTQ
jgi:hypothetical protein